MGPQLTSDILPLLFPLFYAAGLWVTARLTGWHSLARRFPAQHPSSRKLGRVFWGSVQMGTFGNYNHCVVWSAHEEFLRLAPWFYLRVAHSPVHLPWESLHFVQRTRYWLLDGVDVITKDGDRLWLPIQQAKQLRKVSQGKFWPKSTPSKAAN